MVNQFINTLVAFLMGGATLTFSFQAETPGGAVASGTSAAQYETQGTIVTAGEKYRMENSDAVQNIFYPLITFRILTHN